jgi:hypothetical protein
VTVAIQKVVIGKRVVDIIPSNFLQTRMLPHNEYPIAQRETLIRIILLERISSQTLLDLLEVPQRNRTAGTFRRLSKVMTELGWSAVRVRGLTRGAYLEQVRGYCREASGPHAARYS